MKAMIVTRFGDPEVLQATELPMPVPGLAQVRLRVLAAGVNPADWKYRRGLVRKAGEPPLTLGLDVSGMVDAVGEGVTRWHVGDEVFGCAVPPRGAYAEFVVVAADEIAARPRTLDHVHAAALPTAALTAWQAVVAADVRPGHRVLVHAAAGGVGHLAVQIATALGATVVVTARGAKHEWLRRLGAHELIDYTTQDFVDTAGIVDAVIDPMAEQYALRSLAVLRPGGVLVDVRGTGPDRAPVVARAAELGVRFVQLGYQRCGTDLERLAKLVDDGKLSVTVSRTLPFLEAAEAHRLIETGRVRGKIVLVPEPV